LKVGILLLLRHRDSHHFFGLLWKIRQDFGLESPEEERFHDPFGVSDPVFLISRTFVVFALVSLQTKIIIEIVKVLFFIELKT
jgi:hypothetical protein